MMGPGRLPVIADMKAVAHRIFSDPRGSLVPIEVADAIPFPVARLFWVFGVPEGHLRGGHAHRLCSQYLLCVSGALDVVADDGHASASFKLEAGSGLLVPPAIWASERYLTAGTTLLVLCSHAYDVDDYMDAKDDLRAFRAVQGR